MKIYIQSLCRQFSKILHENYSAYFASKFKDEIKFVVEIWLYFNVSKREKISLRINSKYQIIWNLIQFFIICNVG